MTCCDTLIRNASVLDGTGRAAECLDVAVQDGRILDLGAALHYSASHEVDAEGKTLAPGFIDMHTHDDTSVIENPEMLPKLSQGVTTVIVGNCGISASPVRLTGDPPDPMNLLGRRGGFSLPDLCGLRRSAVRSARPAVNVAALVGPHGTAQQPHGSPRPRRYEGRDRGHARATLARRLTPARWA